jgi:iron complex transport system ATP-binding protein
MDKLSVRDLSWDYSGFLVLRNISFSLKEGRMLCILGRNGCGKTTLLRCISGYNKPSFGRVFIDNRDIRSISPIKLSRLIAQVTQSPYFQYDYSVYDLVMMGRNPYIGAFSRESETDVQSVRDAMERTSTAHLANRSILTLSGGEQRRVWIARAIAQKTKLLLLDEPVSGLDIAHQINILSMIRRLCEETGTAALCVLHDINLAAHYAHELMLMKDGQICFSGMPEEVLTKRSIEDAFGIEAEVTKEQNSPYVIPKFV